jgi:rod shape-determining protein MreC
VLLLLTSFTLITLDYHRTGTTPLSGLRSAASAVFGPVERAAAAVVRPVSDFVTNLGDLGDHQQQVDRLQSEVDRLRLDNRTAELARNRSAELDKLLRVASVGQYKVLPARVVAVGAKQDFSWTVTIDAGTRDGIARDMTVLNGDGLVGRVTEVGPWTATVLLAIDPDFRAGVRLESSMDIGYVTGAGDDPMTLDLLNGQAGIGKGDRLVTQGSVNDRPFVPGVPVGEVLAVHATPGSPTKTATVRPFVDFARLDLVGVVVQPPRSSPRDAVLPPKPTPTPKPSPAPTVTVTVTAPPPTPGG